MLANNIRKFIISIVITALIVPISSFAKETSAPMFALAPPLASKPPCQIFQISDRGWDVRTNPDVIKFWDEELVRSVRTGETLGKSFRNRWAFVDISYLMGQALNLKLPKDVLISLINKHIKNRDGKAEVCLEGYDVDGMEVFYGDGDKVIGYTLPIKNDKGFSGTLVFSLERELTEDGKDKYFYTKIPLNDETNVYVNVKSLDNFGNGKTVCTLDKTSNSIIGGLTSRKLYHYYKNQTLPESTFFRELWQNEGYGKGKWHRWHVPMHSIMTVRFLEGLLDFPFFEDITVRNAFKVLSSSKIDGISKRQLLLLAASLHDIGKKPCADKTGNSNDHAEYAVKHLLPETSKRFNLTDKQSEYVRNLIKYHHVRMEDADPKQTQLLNDLGVYWEVALLSYADMLATGGKKRIETIKGQIEKRKNFIIDKLPKVVLEGTFGTKTLAQSIPAEVDKSFIYYSGIYNFAKWCKENISQYGSEGLIRIIKGPLHDVEQIKKRQKVVNELASFFPEQLAGLLSILGDFNDAVKHSNVKELHPDAEILDRQGNLVPSPVYDYLKSRCHIIKKLLEELPETKALAGEYGILDSLQGILEEKIFYNDVVAFNELLEELGGYCVMGTLVRKYNFTKPDFTDTSDRLVIKKALNPAYSRTVKDFVPISCKITKKQNAIIITGFNRGGKTVHLKTIALFTLLAQSGMYVPCEYFAIDKKLFKYFSKIDILSEEEYEKDEKQEENESDEESDSPELDEANKNASTLVLELAAIEKIAKKADENSLVIIDDEILGGSSQTTSNASFFLATMDYFREKGALVLGVTHHLQPLKALWDTLSSKFEFWYVETKKEGTRNVSEFKLKEGGISDSTNGMEEAARKKFPALKTAWEYFARLTDEKIPFIAPAKPQNQKKQKKTKTRISNKKKPKKTNRGYFYSHREKDILGMIDLYKGMGGYSFREQASFIPNLTFTEDDVRGKYDFTYNQIPVIDAVIGKFPSENCSDFAKDIFKTYIGPDVLEEIKTGYDKFEKEDTEQVKTYVKYVYEAVNSMISDLSLPKKILPYILDPKNDPTEEYRLYTFKYQKEKILQEAKYLQEEGIIDSNGRLLKTELTKYEKLKIKWLNIMLIKMLYGDAFRKEKTFDESYLKLMKKLIGNPDIYSKWGNMLQWNMTLQTICSDPETEKKLFDLKKRFEGTVHDFYSFLVDLRKEHENFVWEHVRKPEYLPQAKQKMDTFVKDLRNFAEEMLDELLCKYDLPILEPMIITILDEAEKIEKVKKINSEILEFSYEITRHRDGYMGFRELLFMMDSFAHIPGMKEFMSLNEGWSIPEASGERGVIDIKDGWNFSLGAKRKKPIKNDFSIKPNGNKGGVAVFTGYHTGGKSVFLRAIAQIVACARANIMVPAEYAKIGDFDDIQVITSIGEERRFQAWKSSWYQRKQGEVRSGLEQALDRCKQVIKESGPKTLVILDELFSGATEPNVAAALTAATIEALSNKGATVIAATHLLEVLPYLKERVPHTEFYQVKTKLVGQNHVPTFKFEKNKTAASTHGLDRARQIDWFAYEKAKEYFDQLSDEELVVPGTDITETEEKAKTEQVHVKNMAGTAKYIEAKTENIAPKIFLGISWIKGYIEDRHLQFDALNPLISSIREFYKAKGIEFVDAEDKDLIGLITAEKEKNPDSKVIVLADYSTITSKDYIDLRADKNTFLAGVNNKFMTVDTYVRLVEMLTLTMQLAYGQYFDVDLNNPNITIQKKNGYYIFTPRAEPMDYEDFKARYNMQIFA